MGLLPPELLRLVMENLKSERRTLHALTLTSKGLRWEATRLLYVSMTVASGRAHFKFLSTIRRFPTELAPLVRVYHLPSTPYTGTRDQNCVWNRVLQCLPLMVNLKELTFHMIFGSPLKIFPSLGKDNQASFQLDKFSWTYGASNGLNSEIYEAQALTFLETQHQLTQLHWASRYDVISTLPVNACQKLKCLEGTMNAIGAILPSRLVTELHWLKPWYHDDLISESIQEMVMNSTALQTLRAISVESYAKFRTMLLTLDIGHPYPLSNVEAIEVCIPSDEDSSLTDLLAVLSNFHRLKKLVITMPKEDARYLASMYDLTSQMSQLFAQFRHLKSVDIGSSYLGPVYRRWVDGDLLPNLLSIDRNRILELE